MSPYSTHASTYPTTVSTYLTMVSAYSIRVLNSPTILRRPPTQHYSNVHFTPTPTFTDRDLHPLHHILLLLFRFYHVLLYRGPHLTDLNLHLLYHGHHLFNHGSQLLNLLQRPLHQGLHQSRPNRPQIALTLLRLPPFLQQF
ncbi:hypothetical protein ElyMa_001653900 [Elysia marginata]|uniref:Uncharacterized protein n=1 Tax=Elysia marginata TaxID=1093978 RepID=A0AAV4JRA4_9GAST|nr:hypothetical protein ElyMa_001653900 [Elysia marginata]